MSCSFSTSMKSNCSFSSVLKTNSSFSTVLKTHTYFIPLTPPFGSIFGGGAECPFPVLSQTRIFGPPRPPPIGSILQKIGKNQNRLRMAWNGEKSKKKFCPLVTPPRKKLRKIFKNFFENFLKVVQNHLKREKNSKFFFPYFSVITEKNLEKFFKFFFWNEKLFFEFFSRFR